MIYKKVSDGRARLSHGLCASAPCGRARLSHWTLGVLFAFLAAFVGAQSLWQKSRAARGKKRRQESGEAARKGNGIRPSRAASPLSCRSGKTFCRVFSELFHSFSFIIRGGFFSRRLAAAACRLSEKNPPWRLATAGSRSVFCRFFMREKFSGRKSKPPRSSDLGERARPKLFLTPFQKIRAL